jgi:hypothetical protein
MPQALCPNFSHPAYVYAEAQLGPDKALEIYDAIGTSIIPRAMVDAYVAQRNAEKQILVPHDSKRGAYVGGKDNNGIPFDRINNDRSWEVETQSGLRYDFTTDKNGRRTPVYQHFNSPQSIKKINQLTKEYPGFVFTQRPIVVGKSTKIRVVVGDLTFPVWAKNHPLASNYTQQLKEEDTNNIFPNSSDKRIFILSTTRNLNSEEAIQKEIRNHYFNGERYIEIRPDHEGYNLQPGAMTKNYRVVINAGEKFYRQFEGIDAEGNRTAGEYEYYKVKKPSDIRILGPQQLKEDVTEQPKELYHTLAAKIEVLKKAIPWEVKITYTTDIDGIAQLEPGGREIKINPRKMTVDAIGHEYGHIFIDILGGMSNSLVKQGREQLRGSPLEAAVIAKYPELTGDIRLDKEIITTALGVEVAKIFAEEEAQTKFMRWLIRFFRAVRAKLGIEQNAVRKLAERLVAGTELQTKEKATAEERKEDLFIGGEASQYVQYSKDLDNTASVMDRLIAAEDLALQKAIKVVARKISIYEKRDPSVEVEELKALQPILESSTSTVGMIKMVRYAANSTNRMNNTYIAYVKDLSKGKERVKLNAKLLDAWRTHVSAFDMINEFRALLVKTRDELDVTGTEEDKNAAQRLLFENKLLLLGMFKEKTPQRERIENLFKNKKANIFNVLIPVLDDIIEVKEKIKNLYKDKGRELMIDWLVPVAGLVHGQYREKWEQEWNMLEKKTTTLDRYLSDKLAENGEKIREETRDLVQAELYKADADISYWRRYADTILDSPDVIASAVAKIFFKMQEKTRRETLDWRYKSADRITALEKTVPRPIGMSDEEFYNLYIERDSITGELTDNIVTEIPTKLVSDYLLFKSRVYSRYYRKANGHKLVTEVDRYLELKAWKDKYAPRRREEWNKAQEEFVQSMLDKKMITPDEQKHWGRTYKVTTKAAKTPLKDIFINPDAVNALVGFLSKNNWTYRDVHSKYTELNKQWKELERLRAANPEDERIKYYDFIIEVSNEAENNLPMSYRLGNKIPSMHKNFGQKMRSNDKGIFNSLNEELKERFQLQKYDVNRGELGTDEEGVPEKGKVQIVNEANEPVYFVPVYYVNDIGETTFVLDDNSFKKLRDHDIPSEVISKLQTIKGKVFDTEKHFRDFLEKSNPTAEISPLTAEETNMYMEYIVFDSKKRDLSNKSFDLTSVYYNYLKMSIDFRNKFEIQHEAEMARFFMNNRDVIRRDAGGQPVMDALSKKLKGFTGGDRENMRVDPGNKSQLAYQTDSFYKDHLYGMSSQEEPDINFLGYKINQAKLLDNISGYTALSLLGVNFVAGFANIGLGEITQAIEAWANEVFSAKDMTKATGVYYQNLGGILGDIGERKPSNLIGLLNDQFDTINEYDEESNMIQGRWYAEMMQTNTLFFTSHAGEHYMQTRAMLAMLNHIRAIDDKGNDIGSILDNYSVDKETGTLKFNSEVKNWDNDAKDDFSARMHRILARMHGEYSSIGRSEMQQQALGRMAIMFRRFVIPGFKRRWEKKQYNNLYGDFTEGNYITFGRFIKNISKDLIQFKIDLAKEDWKKLGNREKANIKRTLGELSAFFAASALAALALRAKEDDDKDNWALNMATYQALRLKAELTFFINPAATLQILRSPMASISFAQSLIELVDRGLFYPVTHGFEFEVYQQGSWKEHLKVEKTLTQMFPVYKQYYRLADIKDQLSWFNR